MSLVIHLRTGQLFRVVAQARLCKNPAKRFVVYQQLTSVDEPRVDGERALPAGTMWIRGRADFLRSFEIFNDPRAPS